MSCYDKILWRPQEGETIKMDKLIINKTHDTQLDVVIAIIEHVDGETHFVLSLGTYETPTKNLIETLELPILE